MATSPVYRSAFLYELVMRALYGRHYAARYRTIADLIPDGSSVVELCCGPGTLYRGYLRSKGIAYTGLDVNPRFIDVVIRSGGLGIVRDLHEDVPLPRAQTVLMQASLYHFLPEARCVVQRMLEAAEEQVILAEPIRNLAQSKLPVVARLVARLTDAGEGAEARRFTEESLDALINALPKRPTRRFLIPGGREKVCVIPVAS